jgi:hypothetical protein
MPKALVIKSRMIPGWAAVARKAFAVMLKMKRDRTETGIIRLRCLLRRDRAIPVTALQLDRGNHL